MTAETLTPNAGTARRSLLHTALTLDAAVTGANGLAYLVAAGPLGDLLGLAPALLRGAGAVLVVFALLVAATARSDAPAAAAVRAIIAVNVLWAVDSLVAAIAGWGTPTTAGTVWIVAQAVVVAAFAEMQLVGLRRSRRR
jgi:hypothetical protein